MASAFKNQKRLNSYSETLCSNSCETIIVRVFCEERSRKGFFLRLCEPAGDSYN